MNTNMIGEERRSWAADMRSRGRSLAEIAAVMKLTKEGIRMLLARWERKHREELARLESVGPRQVQCRD